MGLANGASGLRGKRFAFANRATEGSELDALARHQRDLELLRKGAVPVDSGPSDPRQRERDAHYLIGVPRLKCD
jgi:hypothetical protein